MPRKSACKCYFGCVTEDSKMLSNDHQDSRNGYNEHSYPQPFEGTSNYVARPVTTGSEAQTNTATSENNSTNINTDGKKTQESDHSTLLDENNENKLIEEKNIVPNQLYKVISVDGMIQLKECYENEEITNIDHHDSTDHHDYNDYQDIDNQVINDTVIIQDNDIIIKQDVSEEIHNEIDLPEFDTCSEENSVKHETYVDCSGGNAYKIFASKMDLVESRNGNDMVLISLSKYKSIKRRLQELGIKLNNVSNNCVNCTVKNNNMEKLKNQVLVDAKEFNRLRYLKESLCRNYSDGQINMMTNNKRSVAWADKELDKCSYLRQIISAKAYLFLKYQMKFPLPAFSILRKWMIKRNIFVESKKKSNLNKETEDTLLTNVESEQTHSMEQTQDADTCTEQNEGTHTYLVQTEGTNTNTDQTIYANTETTQAVNSIIGLVHPAQAQSVEDPNTEGRYESFGELVQDTDNYICDESFMPVEETVAVERPKRTSMRLKCHLCMRPFGSEREVHAHVPEHYFNTYYVTYLDAQRPYQCEFCGETVKYRTHLGRHHRLHLGINPFKCWHPDCQFVGRNQSALKEHRLRHRAGLACGACPALLPTAGALLRHRARRHEGRALRRCALCGALTHNAERYRRHMRTHLRPPRMKCPEEGCEQAFYSQASLGQHRREHSGNTLYTCPHCPLATYTLLGQLHNHMRRHEMQKISNCSRCQLIFYDYGEFYTHCVTQHGRSERRYECMCGRDFAGKTSLIKHKSKCAKVLERLQHTTDSNEDQDIKSETSLPKYEKLQKKAQKRIINTDGGEILLQNQPKKHLKIVEQTEGVESNVRFPKYTYVRRKTHNEDKDRQNLSYDETQEEPDVIEHTQFRPHIEESKLEPDTEEPASLKLDTEEPTQFEQFTEESAITEPTQFETGIYNTTAEHTPKLHVSMESSQPQSIKLTSLLNQKTISLQTSSPAVHRKKPVKLIVLNKEQIKLLGISKCNRKDITIQGQRHQSIAKGHSREVQNENINEVETVLEERSALLDMPVIEMATQENVPEELPHQQAESCARVQVLPAPSRRRHALNVTRNMVPSSTSNEEEVVTKRLIKLPPNPSVRQAGGSSTLPRQQRSRAQLAHALTTRRVI